MLFGRDDPPPRLRDLTRAFRCPDMSMIIDLSKLPLSKKQEYVDSLLTMPAAIRRRSGLPHRIVLDEAHYFLKGSKAHELLDLDVADYTLVTYRAANLRPDLLRATEAIIVTRETDPLEVRALLALSGVSATESNWESIFAELPLSEAILLPVAGDSQRSVCRFSVGPRLTGHVRHLHKYLDAPVPAGQAFVFAELEPDAPPQAATLKDFLAILARAPVEALDGHLRKWDFSRWIDDVFGDRQLASQIEDLELQYRLGHSCDIQDALISTIGDRYPVAESAGSDTDLAEEKSALG